MSKITLLFSVLLSAIVFGCHNENSEKENSRPEQKKSHITFTRDAIHIGKFKSGTTQDVIFYAHNRSDIPLVIDTVQVSCACTVASFSKKPILKHDSDKIVVTFNPKAGVYGYFKKNVVVSANTRPAFSVLTIEGEIIP